MTKSGDLARRDEGEAELLARIERERGASVAAVDRLDLLAEFHSRYPQSGFAEEVLALTVEARAEAGLYSEALDASRRYREQFPDGPRIQQVYWIEGTVARDRLHDCARALPSYRALMADEGVYQARAAYFYGLCALDTGDAASGREALEESLQLGLGGSEADRARELLAEQ